MYLVKSCFKGDNVIKRKTLKIGSLTEYRDTELTQIADKEEGTIKIQYNLKDLHIDDRLWNIINIQIHSLNNININELTVLNRSPILPNHTFVERLSGEFFLKYLNRFTFCMSILTSPEQSVGIFKDYDDYWHIKSCHIDLFAGAISNELIKAIKSRISRGEQLFRETPNINYLSVKWSVGNVQYEDRAIAIDNHYINTKREHVINVINKAHFIKSKQFQPEQEVRFVFDIYEGKRLLHPLDKFIIINADTLMPLIKNH
ncbi:hypothetical protein MXM83_25855 [Klebsiella quasipneumoniae]|uniref:hypothetical protein n=1 Tax=Klebsiella quasipneumoniae TaxID=1463165 RepID=UPI002AD66059|nr:hypothetical protein [Klebsiella quasipneumoniae]MDZ9811927.1 hypothetical protein [Escherichia coli]MEB5581436.1 hypothetical protein [Klebsiella quasipneumoniae]MEB5747934.1 hypothetical protein [Klebsiella quasipneumoniae]